MCSTPSNPGVILPTLHCAVVDDRPASANLAKALLETRGYKVTVHTSPEEAVRQIPKQRPDVVLLDILMPGMDGFEVCQRLRSCSELADTRVIMCTSKAFDFDRRRAADLGADGYVVKPLQSDNLFDAIDRAVANKMALTFWGSRGTLPRSGPGTVRYGGNTSCVSVEFPRGQIFIFDAGTGIRDLGQHLAARNARVEGKVFLSHPHWDHINAIPFFAPFYVQGNEFEILGPRQGDVTVRDMVNDQMHGVYFPITTREFAARIEFTDLGEGSFDFGDVNVQTMLLAHPGNCLGYRLNYDGRSISYVTDNELLLKTAPHYSQEFEDQLLEFIQGSDALIIDMTYSDEEYESKVGWGHSSVTQVVDLARRGRVKVLYPFHHDPSQDDADIERKLKTAEKLLEGSDTRCAQPIEGESVHI